MKERLLNQLSLTRRLRQFLVLFTLLLMPLGAWADDYSKTIYVDSKGETVYITSDNAEDILGDGTMIYDATNNVLTLDNAELSCTATNAVFISCVDWSQDLNTLTINLVGSNTITLGDNAGFFYGSALTFTTDDNYPGSLTIIKENGWSGILFENSASGDPTITPTYNNHLYVDHDVESECLIQWLVCPGPYSYNDGNNIVFRFGDETGNDDEEIHYSIDYVDENLQDVTDAVYDVSGNDQPLLGPCTMTYYITAGGGQSETNTAKLFGLATNSVTTTFGTPVAPPTIVPAFDHSEDLIITETQTPATGVAPEYNGTTGLISTSATGETTCSAKLSYYEASSYDYLVLNDMDGNEKYVFGSFTLTVNEAENYNLTIGGVAVTSANASNVLGNDETPTVMFDAATNTLTLSDGASVGQITYSGTSNLTIAFSGMCSITTEQTYAIQYVGSESARPKLTFSLTNETGSLSINGESLVIEGFSDVDFGGLNLASRSGQGVYYDSSEYGYHMAGYGGNPNNLTITTETYHPIWIYDPSLGQEASHTQLNSNKLSVAFGEGTISFDGNHTITMNNVDFNYEDNTLIVVGPGMEELTVNLVGTSTVRSGSIFLSLWATTPLTFTTNESTPGTLTGYDIVSWMDFGNGQISYQNGLNVFYDVENSYKKTISTTGTYFKIGNTEVSATGDITTSEGTAHFDASSNTLTLTGATIGSTDVSTDIQVLVDNLIIEISGTNTIYGNITYNGSNYQSSNIQINKASNVESASLKVTNVEGFTSCTWGDGLYLSAQDAQGATVDVHYEHYEGEGGSMQSYYGEIAEVTFSNTQPSNTIWVNGISPNADGNFIDPTTNQPTEGLSFNASKSTLTLTNASISTNDNHPSPIIVCNGDLTVNLVGEDNQVYFNGNYGTYVFKNNASTGTLTFTGDGFLGINTDYDEGTYFGLCDGFSTVDFGDLAYTINGDSKKISPLDISTPMMNVYEGKIDFITDGYLFGSTTYYKIVYADGSGNGEEVPLTNFDWSNFNEKITISELTGPCTVYAYTKYKTETGNSAKAKLFGPAEEIQRIVYGETASLAIAPAIEDGDGIKISGIEANNLSFDSETGEVTGTTIGSTSFPVPLSYTSGEFMPGNTIILNSENFYMDVEIVPPAPTISLEAGTYLSTHDPITITRTGLDNTTNTTIKYKWDDGTAQTYEEAIPVQNGTLTAWVEYSDGTTTVSSEEVTAEYTVNTDIATLYVAPIEDITYTGSAVTPTIVVKATEEAEASLVSGTDYTVSYKQGETAVAAAALINVATYTVVISGNGSYGGTKEVTFNIIKATPNITFAQESYSATLGEAFTSPATVDNWTVSPTASSNTSVANISEGQIVLVGVGTTMITVTYAGNDNYNSTTASYELVVSRALDIAFAGTNSWASYYSTETLAVPEGLTAYVVSSVNEETGAVTVASIEYIPANNAVLLKREQNGAANGYTAAAYTGSTSTFTNLLGGSTSATNISSLGSGPVYVLFNDKFKRAISGTIPARRAYLVPGTMAPAGAPQYLTISIVDGNTTAIDTLTVDDNSNDSWYTIDGLKLNGKPQRKGLYINNGKKVYINNNK